MGYNSMKMLSLASGIIILLFGLMMKTYSPSTTVLQYVSDSENISYYVRLALDRGTVGLFFFPIALLLSSLILDIHRNVTYYKNHKNMEKMQLERGKMKADAANTADHIREWRLKEEKKMEDEITILTAEHDKDVLRITTLYNTKHEELEGNLKQEMVRRVEIEELIHKLSMQTPEDSSESKRITKQLKDLNQQRKEIVNRIDHINDELTELTVQFRNNKMHIHEKIEKLKREKRAKLKQRLDKRLREQDRRLKRKYRKTYDKNMPVKMQCRVLVTKNKFDQAYAQHGSHMATERLLTNRLKNAKSEVFDEHKKIMDKLQDNHVQSKQKMIDDHEEMIGNYQDRLEDLRVDKNINEDQIRNLEEACNKQKNALLQELGKEKFDEHMKLLERIKRRKLELQKETAQLNETAKAESWNAERLNEEINALHSQHKAETKLALDAANSRHSEAHNRLMQRLMKVKATEAKSIGALEAVGQGSPEQIDAIHGKAADEIKDILEGSGFDGEVVTDAILKSMYDLNVQENDALRHMKEDKSLDSNELTQRVQAIRDRTEIEAATISAQISKNHEKHNEKLLKRLAARKQKEAVEITGAINLAQITGKSKEEVQAEIALIKERAEKDISGLMKNIGMRSDKKHQKLMERLANRKAKEIHNIEEIRQAAQINGDSVESVNSKIEAVKLAVEKDTSILVQALADRGNKQKEKQSNKIARAINKLAEISILEDKAKSKMEELEGHENAMESRIQDMENQHKNEMEGLNRKLKEEKNAQQDSLQKRLRERRQNARKAGVSKAERRQIEQETKTIEDLAKTRRLREEAEEDLKQISAEFDHHQEELAKHMAIEKEQQKANIEARLRRRRSRNAAAGKKKGADNDKSARHLNALLETRKRMEQDILRRAYERMSKGGLTSEQQLRALLQDVQRVVGQSVTKQLISGKIAPPQLQKPSKEALEEAKKVTNS